MCTAIPVGLLLLLLLCAGTVYRFFRPCFPNAVPLVVLMNDLSKGAALDEIDPCQSVAGQAATEH